MAIARVKVWIAGEILTAADLNAEFNNIINNPISLWSPAAAAVDLNGNELILDADADTSLTADTDNRIDLRLRGADLFRFDGTVASPVNGYDFIGVATGSRPRLQAVGSDTNIGLGFRAKGTGGIVIEDGNGNEVLIADAGTASAVNEITLTNAATGGAPVLKASGGDTNIPLRFSPKGTGRHQFTDGTDLTKILALDVSAITTATTRTRTIVDASGTEVIAERLQTQTYVNFTTGGSATAFTLTPSPAITANTSGTRFSVTFNAAAGASPTLAVSGLTALNLKFRDVDGTLQAITALQVPSGWISDVMTDGTDWIVLSPSSIGQIKQNSQSAAYTTVLSDNGKHIYHPSADTTARIWTIDSNANVPYPVGAAITFVNDNAAGVLTISITSDTMRLAGHGTTGSRTLAANGIATAVKMTSTSWIISGTGLT